MTTTVQLVTDSRGRNILPKLIHHTNDDLDIEWNSQVLPGANLETISKWIERTQRRRTWDITIIIAGICNFTRKVQSRNKRYLEYTTRKADEIKSTIDLLLNQHGITTHLCTITPAVLSKFSNHRDGDTDIVEEQTNLLSDIEDVNEHIKLRNIERDTATYDLAVQSYTKSLKRQGQQRKKIIKFSGKDLPDGVHPSISLEDTWAKYLVKVTASIINRNNTTENTTEDSDQEQSDSDQDQSGNFKRAKRN